MTYHYLFQEKSNTHLLLFMNGWGMTEAAIRHLLPPPATDLLVVYDYRFLETLPKEIYHYKKITLVAWSIGVWATEQLAKQNLLPPLDKTIALAGSPFIRHDTYGIPNKIFDLTLDTLDQTSREQFNRRMCGGKTNRELFLEFEKRTTEELREELTTVRKVERRQKKLSLSLHWDALLIAGKDKIIPPKNLFQLATDFLPHTEVKVLPHSTHFLFADFTSWIELFALLQ